ncbi:microtubule-associated protein 70-5-like isoform X2 [Tripterygium wilfordii]|uniref:microtubule-associated protein 70-5-like isoform X2 n=1 Tax=Tripterygium wilfordii TaxID=458696 RepID=UPI0018F7F2D3|nr:microtubule-associated protein 70-5-like isoform X2 [Tripterygium wilfordii]
MNSISISYNTNTKLWLFYSPTKPSCITINHFDHCVLFEFNRTKRQARKEMVGHEDQQLGGGGEDLSLVHPDPLVLELNRLQNLLKEKDRELGFSQGEIKALRATEVLKDKAIEELRNEVGKLDEKLSATENLLEHKNLEIKELTSEKKDALASQYAAEATLRRVHANQKDDDSVPLESVIAPLEAEIKLYKNEIAALQEDKKALGRLTKSKESALLEAERILRSALERALVVEEVQNQNFELKRQIEICQEENKILEKTNRQKVLEVEKLTQTIQELEEAILAGGAAANAIRDYRRQISELQEEKRTLEREFARIKVSANRVATVVANEWKDENDKVMPVRLWLEERRLLQAEMHRLRDKLAISERTAKAEAQLKAKLKVRLKTLEEGLRHVSSFSVNPDTFSGSPKTEKSNNIFGFLTNNSGVRKRSSSQPRGSTISRVSLSQHPSLGNEAERKQANNIHKRSTSGENMLRKSLWASKSKIVDSSGKENTQIERNMDVNLDKFKDDETTTTILAETKNKSGGNEETQNKRNPKDQEILPDGEDTVSGFLYDRLQKEVINLRKACEVKEDNLNAKDQEIKMLMKKVDALTKAMEVEAKKLKREAATREKEASSMKVDDNKKIRNNINSSKRPSKAY